MTWTYYFARKFSAQRFEILIRVYCSEFYLMEFNARLKNNLIKPAGDNHAIYYLASEWQSFAHKIYHKTCQDLKTFNRYVDLIKKTQAHSLKVAETITKKPLTTLPWQQLGKLWLKWDKAHLDHFIKPIMIPFIIEPLLAKDAQAVLKKYGIALEKVFSPDEPNAILSERISLLNIALKNKAGHKIDQDLANHAKKFAFIPCYDVIDKPWTKTNFRAELKKLLKKPTSELKEQITELKTQFAKNKRAFEEVLRSAKLSGREKELLMMAHQLVYIKDERDDYRRRQSFTIRPLFMELAKRYRLPFRAPLYLINREMHHWFKTGKLPVVRAELKQRMKGYCLARISGQPTQIYSGQKMANFLATQKFSDDQTKSATELIKGMVGNKGIIQGRAVIIITKHDLRKVQHGDVLIAVTTNPDYVPAMRKSRAFVTDEGGITSHAAIVAREMDKPCLVGTKIATKTFHDGDLVEVNADQGIVKRIEK